RAGSLDPRAPATRGPGRAQSPRNASGSEYATIFLSQYSTSPHLSVMVDAGSRERFHDLFVRYQDAVCAVAYSVLRDRARSEEVAQDAFLVAWSKGSEPTAGW